MIQIKKVKQKINNFTTFNPVGIGLGSAAEAISEVPGKISQTIGGTANAIRNNIRSKTDKIFGKRVDKEHYFIWHTQRRILRQEKSAKTTSITQPKARKVRN